MDLPRFELTSLQLEPQRLALLASQALLPFLRRQRWFGTRTKAVSTASFDDVLPIPGAPAPLALVLATVAFDDASRQSWQLLLAAADPRTVSEDDAIAFVDLPDGTACIYDALRSPADCNQLVSSLLSCSGWTSSRGRCNVVASDLLRSLARPSVVTPLGVDQSNTSLLLGQGALMKLFRRVEPGPNPDVELADLLTSLGFAHAPRLLGHVSWIPDDGAPRTLAAFHEFVPTKATAGTTPCAKCAPPSTTPPARGSPPMPPAPAISGSPRAASTGPSPMAPPPTSHPNPSPPPTSNAGTTA